MILGTKNSQIYIKGNFSNKTYNTRFRFKLGNKFKVPPKNLKGLCPTSIENRLFFLFFKFFFF